MGEEEESAEEQKQTYEELAQKHVHFRLENTVLSDHLTRLVTRKGSDHLHLQLEALEEDIRETEDGSEAQRTSRSSVKLPLGDGGESSGRESRLGSLRRSSQRASITSRPCLTLEVSLPLSLEEKCEIAEDESTAIAEQIIRYKNESERTLDDLRAVIEETDLSIAEINKERSNFQREVMFEAEMRNSTYASSDRVLRQWRQYAKN